MGAEDTAMDRNRNLTVVLAFAAGLLGSLLSRYVTLPGSAFSPAPGSPAGKRALLTRVRNDRAFGVGDNQAI